MLRMLRSADGQFILLMVFGLLAFAAAFVWHLRREVSDCAAICEMNGATGEMTSTMGCFCRDDRGVYNPHDSREQ